jgi:hypothetical protein
MASLQHISCYGVAEPEPPCAPSGLPPQCWHLELYTRVGSLCRFGSYTVPGAAWNSACCHPSLCAAGMIARCAGILGPTASGLEAVGGGHPSTHPPTRSPTWEHCFWFNSTFSASRARTMMRFCGSHSALALAAAILARVSRQERPIARRTQ